MSKHGLTTEILRQTNLLRLSQCNYFISKTHFNSCNMECFIYKGGCGIRVSRYLKEELTWAIDKQFSLLFRTTVHYPTTDLQRSYKLRSYSYV